MERPLYQAIASKFDAVYSLRKNDTESEWEGKHLDAIGRLVKEHLPSGNGFDAGTKFDDEASRPGRLIFTTYFHHMNDAGFYVGWTDHRVIVTPSLAHGYELKVTGKGKRQIKDYIADTFHEALRQHVNE